MDTIATGAVGRGLTGNEIVGVLEQSSFLRPLCPMFWAAPFGCGPARCQVAGSGCEQPGQSGDVFGGHRQDEAGPDPFDAAIVGLGQVALHDQACLSSKINALRLREGSTPVAFPQAVPFENSFSASSDRRNLSLFSWIL
jgi:hypothetical protein